MRYIVTILLLLCVPSISQGISRTISNPQTQMVSSRISSLGITNPVIAGDIGAMYANPASLGDVESMPLSLSSKKLLDEFDYTLINIGLPLDLRIPIRDNKTMMQHIMFGLSYGEVSLSGIPETILDAQGNPRAISTFSSGYRVGALGAGTTFYDLYGFDALSIGSSMKMTQFYTLNASASTFSLDLGAIGTHYIEYGLIDKLHAGIAIQNILAPPMKHSETGNEGLLPFEFYAGLRADILDEKVSLYGHNGIDGLTLGAEYYLQDSLVLRGSSDFTRLNLGTGIIFERVAIGFGNRDFSLRLDYNYSQNAAPFEAEPNHSVSFSILGESRPKAPRILSPPEEFLITYKQNMNLKGVGPRNTAIRFYNNQSLSRTVVSDKYGKWAIKDFPLKEGRNLIYLRSYSLDKDTSLESYPIVIYSDTQAPKLEVQVLPDNDYLVIKIKSNENLDLIEASILNTPLTFYKDTPKSMSEIDSVPETAQLHDEPTHWIAEIKTPEELSPDRLPKDMFNLQLRVVDEAGNDTNFIEYPFFASVEFPQDKYVHYKPSIRFLGRVSDMILNLSINDNPVYIDNSQQFAIPIDLDPGKNNVRLSVKGLNETIVDYSMRILRLATFPDLNDRVRGRREIEFLATLGILTGDDDGKFYPIKPVTRQYVAKLMVLANGGDSDTLPEVTTNLFNDVPANHPFASYIQTAVESGLIFAFPDGTFKPEQALTLSETIFLLSNAGIINYQDSGEDENSYVSRSQLAEFLAYSAEYELKIEQLINWEKGY